MTGMKEGAGEDPFADTDDSTDSAATEQESSTTTDVEPDPKETQPAENAREPKQQVRIPYKFRRDGVQDGRDRVPLFIKPETKSAERDAQRELEERFSDDVSLTDLREAVVRTGLEHLDEVEEQLTDWGYGMTFEE